MSGRRGGGAARGWKHSSVAALAALGCCLLSAPTANADFDDLIDSVLGAATAGPDLGDVGGVPADLGTFDVQNVLNDPLAQLDQVFHDSPGQLGLGEPTSGPADTGHGTGTTPDTPTGTTPDSHPDSGSGSTTGSEHQGSGGNSSNSPSLPKFSLPSGGSGNGGSGGGGNGGGGGGNGGGNNATKTKSNSSANRAGAGRGSATPGDVPAAP
ncbi:hypothetical protein [[Mycobacterium] crassicus]|uniref:Uncharacterized protein n=1 Tax=[Mycobacterium] crassicus TaxID=2872309 RepID=A0ABU5XDR8_9MYCO|nr:hypothetical protein [Mycolicibacter sp. MYC098]MEB3020466.1 hypothetical protein [Mycolicibacter sp. MYC098]